MGSCFGKKRAGPATDPTDTVIPFHYFDDISTLHDYIIDLTLRFDDILDPQKLRHALVRLLELGNWRKLGCRIRRTAAGKFECHVPASFDEKRPAITFSHANFETSIEEHPVASKIPKATERPALHPSSRKFAEITRGPNAPKTLEDYIEHDQPLLALHVVSFTDTTLVTITWNHVLMDGMGAGEFFHAWTLVLNGKEDEVPPLHGFDKDPFEQCGFPPANGQHVLEKQRLKKVGWFRYAMHYIYDYVRWREQEELTISLPDAFVQSLKQAAIDELAANGKNDQGVEKPYLSDNDIICAWLARTATRHILPPDTSKQLVVQNSHSLRKDFAEDLLPRGTAYTSNAISLIFAIMPAAKAMREPLGYTASQVRRSVREQATRQQDEALLSAVRWSKGTMPTAWPMFGTWNCVTFFISSWSRAGFHDADFSGAVVHGKKNGEEGPQSSSAPWTAGSRIGRPAHMFSVANTAGWTRYIAVIWGKDPQGNWWLQTTLRAETWRKIRAEMEMEMEKEKEKVSAA